jgi:hypothetical protein
LIVPYTARSLDLTTAAEFRRHLESCDACRLLAAQQEAVWLALDDWRPPQTYPGFDDCLLGRIAERASTGWRQRLLASFLQKPWSWRPALSVAAACAVLVMAFLLKDSSQPPSPAPANPRIEQRVQSALDDMDLLKELDIDSMSASPQS